MMYYDFECVDDIFGGHTILRHSTQEVMVGNIKIGNSNPIVIQSMALGHAHDIQGKAQEVVELAKAGSELVRIALNSDEAAQSIPYIRDELVKKGFNGKILVGCGQYEIERLLHKYPDYISALGKLRINPGNIGFKDKRDKNFEKVIEYAIKYDMPVRIGVNWGSVDKSIVEELMKQSSFSEREENYDFILRKALVISALSSAKYAEKIGLKSNKIILSCKVSKVQDLIVVYKALAKLSNYALHLGLTESGLSQKGTVSTSCALSYLLLNGIGDTIRASVTQQPGQSRVYEVLLCQEILQSLGLRSFVPKVVSCPGCGRTNGLYFQRLAFDVDSYIKKRMPIWKSNNSKVENVKIAVMGCIVNGPGESKHSDLGISLPGDGEKSAAAVYMKGKKYCTLKGDDIFEKFTNIIEDYIRTYCTE